MAGGTTAGAIEICGASRGIADDDGCGIHRWSAPRRGNARLEKRRQILQISCGERRKRRHPVRRTADLQELAKHLPAFVVSDVQRSREGRPLSAPSVGPVAEGTPG